MISSSKAFSLNLSISLSSSSNLMIYLPLPVGVVPKYIRSKLSCLFRGMLSIEFDFSDSKFKTTSLNYRSRSSLLILTSTSWFCSSFIFSDRLLFLSFKLKTTFLWDDYKSYFWRIKISWVVISLSLFTKSSPLCFYKSAIFVYIFFL